MAIQSTEFTTSPVGPLYTYLASDHAIITGYLANKRFGEVKVAINVDRATYPDMYVFVLRFSAKNTDRGQFTVNGVQIFDSETHGSGEFRITTVWGHVPSKIGTDGKVTFQIQGAGSSWIGTDATIYIARTRDL